MIRKIKAEDKEIKISVLAGREYGALEHEDGFLCAGGESFSLLVPAPKRKMALSRPRTIKAVFLLYHPSW